MRGWIKALLIGSALILLALAVLAWFALMTASGARLALEFVEPRIPGALSYAKLNGRLVGPLELEGVRYEHGAVEVGVERLALDWQPRALLGRRLHVYWLRLEGVVGRLDPEALSDDGDKDGETRRTSGAEGSEEPGGPLPAIQLDDVQATGVRFEAGDRAALRETNLAASGTLDDYAVRLGGELSADLLPRSTIALAGRGSLRGFALDSFSLESGAGTIAASGAVEWRPDLRWDLAVHGDSLAPGAIAEDPAEWPGWVTLKASARGSLIKDSPAADIAIDTLHGSVRGFPISGSAALELEGSTIFVPEADIEWGPLAIRADGVYADTIDFAFEIAAPDLSGVLPGGRGSIRAEGRASGQRSTPHVEASLSAHAAAYGDLALASAEGRVVLDLSPTGAVDASVRMSGLETPQLVIDELDVGVRGRVDGHELQLRAGNDEYAIALRARGGVAGEVWRGEVEQLEVGTQRTGDWSLRAPVSLALSRDRVSLGELCLASAEGGLCAAGEFAGEASWHGVASLEGIPLSIARPFLPPELILEGTVDASLDFASSETALPVGQAEVSLSSGYAEVARERDTLRVSHGGDFRLISSAGALAGDLEATLALEGGGGSARVAVGITVSDALSALEPGDLLATLTNGDWTAGLSLEDLQLSRLQAFLPAGLRLEGSLDAALDATTETGRVRGALVIEPSTGTIELAWDDEAPGLEFRELSVRVNADDGEVAGTMQFSLHGLGGRSLGGMQVEARSNAIVLARPLADRALEADAKGSFDLATLTSLTHGFVEAAGSADLDFSLRRDSGGFETLGQARVRGRADVPALGIALEDLSLSVDGDGGRLVIDGRVSSGEGHLTLSGESVRGGSTLVRLEGERFLAIARDELRLEINPDLQLGASGTRIDLSGEVSVPTARIELLEVPATGVGVSDDVVLVGVEEEPEITEPTFVETFTDVTLSLGEDVSFRGLGLTTMIDGSLKVTDQPGTPSRGDGILTLRDGRFRGFGLNLVIDPGELVFSGPLDQPRLRVRAYRRADDGTRAGLAINGPADSPRLEIYSEPRLSDQEALSYMFSGQPLDRGSTQLNRANTQQAQAEGGGALMGSNVLTQAVGMAIGLDETRIDAGNRREDAQFIAGKYISPRLYVAYVTGLFENVSLLRVRYTLYKGFRLQAETGTRETVDLLYRFDVGK